MGEKRGGEDPRNPSTPLPPHRTVEEDNGRQRDAQNGKRKRVREGAVGEQGIIGHMKRPSDRIDIGRCGACGGHDADAACGRALLSPGGEGKTDSGM